MSKFFVSAVGLFRLQKICAGNSGARRSHVLPKAVYSEQSRSNFDANAAIFGCVKYFRAPESKRMLDAFHRFVITESQPAADHDKFRTAPIGELAGTVLS